MKLNWVQNSHRSRRMDIQIFSDLILEDTEIDIILISPPGDPDHITEVVNSLGRISPSPHSVDSEHPRIIPPVHQILEYESVEGPLGEHSVGDVEARVLPHTGLEHVEFLQEPVVQLPPDLELQGAEGVGDPLQAVAYAVSEVVQRVYAPLVTCVRVGRVPDAVDCRVPQRCVRMLVVDLGTQAVLVFLEQA